MPSLRCIRIVSFSGDALDDAGMSNLVPLDPIFVYVNRSLLTGTGVARFGEMKSLTGLATLHIVKPTQEAKEALSNHPALETLRLWPKGVAWLTDASVKHFSTIPKLKKLTVDLFVLSYDRGLNLLNELPNLSTLEFHEAAIFEADLAKLKADLPRVQITFSPMPPEYRAQWEAWAARLSGAKK